MSIRNTAAEAARREGRRPQDIPKPAPKPRSETQISASIRKRAEKLGALISRVQSGTVTAATGHRVQMAAPGTSDNLGLLPVLTRFQHPPIGVFLAVEVKRPGNTPTEIQARFLARVNEAGGIGLWATSADEFEAKLRTELARRGWTLCAQT